KIKNYDFKRIWIRRNISRLRNHPRTRIKNRRFPRKTRIQKAQKQTTPKRRTQRNRPAHRATRRLSVRTIQFRNASDTARKSQARNRFGKNRKKKPNRFYSWSRQWKTSRRTTQIARSPGKTRILRRLISQIQIRSHRSKIILN